jgi:autoinducer 2-degrading protein
MIVRIVTVNVKAGREADFEDVARRNHEGSVAEAGVLRFDVLKDRETPGRYYLYEAYRDEAATRAHKETAHYAAFKEAAADLMEGQRTSVACEVVEPAEESAWEC